MQANEGSAISFRDLSLLFDSHIMGAHSQLTPLAQHLLLTMQTAKILDFDPSPLDQESKFPSTHTGNTLWALGTPATCLGFFSVL